MCSWIANKKRWFKLQTDGSEKSICHVFWQPYSYTAEHVNIVIRCLYLHHRIIYDWFYFQVDFIITGTLRIIKQEYVALNFWQFVLFAIMHWRSPVFLLWNTLHLLHGGLFKMPCLSTVNFDKWNSKFWVRCVTSVQQIVNNGEHNSNIQLSITY